MTHYPDNPKEIPFTQYLRPDGEPRTVWTDVTEAAARKFHEEMAPLGLTLTAECVPGGYVAICVSNDSVGADYNTALINNGPGLQEKIAEMIEHFKLEHYVQWLASLDDEEPEEDEPAVTVYISQDGQIDINPDSINEKPL